MRQFVCIGLVLGLAAVCRGQAVAAGTGAPRFALARGDADAFVYERGNDVHVINGITTPMSVTLMVAHLTEQGIETRELLTHALPPDSLTASLGRVVCVAAGKFYFNAGGWLNCLDAGTGKIEQLDEAIAPLVLDGNIYFPSHSFSEHLTVLDAASQTATYLISWQGEPSAIDIRKTVLSPDVRRIAWIAGTPGAGSGWRIGVLDLAARTNMQLVAKLPYTQARTKLLFSPDLIGWRDNKTLLTVTNDAPAEPGAAVTGAFLTALDVGTGKLTRLCAIPAAAGVRIVPPTPNTDLSIVTSAPSKQLTFDERAMTLRESPMRFGMFERDETGHLTIKGAAIPIDPGDVQNGHLSPDGKRLPYVRDLGPGGGGELHLFDGAAGADHLVGNLGGAGMSGGWWFHYADMAVPAVARAAPVGFVSIEELHRSAHGSPANEVLRVGE